MSFFLLVVFGVVYGVFFVVVWFFGYCREPNIFLWMSSYLLVVLGRGVFFGCVGGSLGLV